MIENLRAFRAWRAQPVAIRDTKVGSDALIRGEVETAGFVEPAPVTERETVVCVVTFTIAHTAPADGQQPFQYQGMPIFRARAVQPFYVIDANGDRLLVNDKTIIVRLREEYVAAQLLAKARPGTPLAAFMRKNGLFRDVREYEANEQIVARGQTVEVFGRIEMRPWLERTAYRETMSEVHAMFGPGVVVREPRDR
jgi:hypothetical protein